MRAFEDFLGTNEVRKTSYDLGLAKSLRSDAEERVKFVLQTPLSDEFANIFYEQIYEALRAHINALLAIEGFKSYSHVATIAVLQRYPNFSNSELNRLDNAREKRNLSMYYAKKITLVEAKELIVLYQQLKPKLDEIFNRLIKR